jgi:hypothetical protein
LALIDDMTATNDEPHTDAKVADAHTSTPFVGDRRAQSIVARHGVGE